ncbi:MAG: hypothetical protein KF716_10235 [Anaerolineae bacterium]|nr:hypothetical protein [Anaerolineae bacterium]
MATMTAGQPSGGLLPFTRLVLIVSAVVQLIFGAVGLFLVPLWNSFFWTSPLPAWPDAAMHFASLNYLATAIAALYALQRGTWESARTYFAFSFPYIILSVIIALITAADPGVPTIMWLYVLLSVLYLPAVAYAWRSQART